MRCVLPWLDRWAAKKPDAAAFEDEKTCLTWRQLHDTAMINPPSVAEKKLLLTHGLCRLAGCVHGKHAGTVVVSPAYSTQLLVMDTSPPADAAIYVAAGAQLVAQYGELCPRVAAASIDPADSESGSHGYRASGKLLFLPDNT